MTFFSAVSVSEECLYIDLCCLCCTDFPEGMSHFLMNELVCFLYLFFFCLVVSGFFYFFFFFVLLEVQPFPILLRGQGCLCHLPHLILDTGEEVVKNIFFCMTEHCCTQSI